MPDSFNLDLHELFVNIPEALVAIAPDYTVLAATDKYLSLVLRTCEELIGKNLLATSIFNSYALSLFSINQRHVPYCM